LAVTFAPETLECCSKAQVSDFSLVSSKNLSETLPFCGSGPGPDDLSQ